MPDRSPNVSLSVVLRSEGQQIESLSYALWSLRYSSSSAATDSSPDAQRQIIRDVDQAMAQLRDLELNRALLASRLTSELDQADDVSLIELAESLGDPWRAPLLIHRTALSEAISEVDSLTADIARQNAHGPTDHLVSRAVPRSLVWFLRTPLGASGSRT